VKREEDPMQDKMMELLLLEQQKQEVQRVLATNEKTAEFGLTLTEEDVRELMICRKQTLQEQRRVEFGGGILPALIEAFCDSSYLEQHEYVETLEALQETFYLFKNESADNLTDQELLTFMREQFDGICFGSVEYLADTCLERFARAIRSGYRRNTATGGRGEYEELSEEKRWDYEVYMAVIRELFDWSSGE